MPGASPMVSSPLSTGYTGSSLLAASAAPLCAAAMAAVVGVGVQPPPSGFAYTPGADMSRVAMLAPARRPRRLRVRVIGIVATFAKCRAAVRAARRAIAFSFEDFFFEDTVVGMSSLLAIVECAVFD